jgi:hypothetical protein
MSEADRIRREQMLKAAMGATQPVPMAGYPTPEGGMTPSLYYQGLMARGMSKYEAAQEANRQGVIANEQSYNQQGVEPWHLEGEY